MEKQQGMNRREFLLVAGGAAIAVPLAAVLGGCGGGSGTSTPAPSTGDFVVTSVPTIPTTHTHTITVKGADLTAGVQVTYTTSVTGNHSHTVTITPAQINDINGGKTDIVGTNADSTGHSHDFDIKKP